MKTAFIWTSLLALASARVIKVRESLDERGLIQDIEASATTLVELAEELSLNLLCLELANPLVVFLTQGQDVIVPIACCGTSCQGPLCSQRSQCTGKSTASKGTGTATVIITSSTSSTSSTPVTTSSTSSPVTSSTSSTPSSSSSTVPSTSSTSSTSVAPITSSTSSSTSAEPSTSSTSSSSSVAPSSTSSSSSVAPTTSSTSSSSSVAPTTSSTSSSTTSSSTTSSSPPAATTITPGQLPFEFVNNAGNGANAYITGTDVATGKFVFVQPDGTFYYTTPNSQVPASVAIPLGAAGSTTKVTTPGFINSGRVYFAQGTLSFSTVADGSLVQPDPANPSDPSANTDWGFIEFTYLNGSGLYANLSFVDFVGLLFGIQLQTNTGLQTAKGLKPGSVATICNSLNGVASKDQSWGNLCQKGSDGNYIRANAPDKYIAEPSNTNAFSTYWTDYVNQVWDTYTSKPLNVVTQFNGTVPFQVSNGVFSSTQDPGNTYAKPSAAEIFGCSGVFLATKADTVIKQEFAPIFCAAFDRSTLLLSGGDTQPGPSQDNYYTVDPTNYYSKFVHENEIDGKGYGFAYDDVYPPGGYDPSGALTDPNPQVFTVFVGGNSS